MTPQKPKVDYRKVAKQTIERRRLKSGTTRGFGTGAGKVKGQSRLKVSGRARLLLHNVDAALKQGLPEEELAPLLAAVSFTEPEVYAQALKLHPLVGEHAKLKGKVIKPATLIRPEVFRKPTPTELFGYIANEKGWDKDKVSPKLAAKIMRDFRKKNPVRYEQLSQELIFTRLTPAELALLKALQHATVRKAADQLSTATYVSIAPQPHLKPHRPRKPVHTEQQQLQPNTENNLIEMIFCGPKVIV